MAGAAAAGVGAASCDRHEPVHSVGTAENSGEHLVPHSKQAFAKCTQHY